ncbi:MAG: hypothetical protein IPO08_22225, partial [Xanthomonadales bacterium]|nr:hypothetical protein [Xanthomonadales bacterium]
MDPSEEDPFAAVSPGLAFTDGQGSELVEDQLPAPPDYPTAAPSFQEALPEPAPTPPPVAEAPSPFSGLLGKAKSWAGSLFDSSAAAKAEAKNTLAAEIERRKRGLQQASDPDPGLMGDSWGIMSPEERHLRTADRAEGLPGEIARTKALRGYADTASDVTPPPLPGVMTPKPLFDLAESFFGTRQDKLAQEQQDIDLQRRGLAPMARKTPLRSGAERFLQSGINMGSGAIESAGVVQGYLLEGAANLGVGKSIGLDEDFDPATAPIYQLGHKLRTWTEASFPGDPARQNEVFQNVSDGAAQMIALYGPAAALKILSAGDKAALATSALTGVSMEMPMAFNEATSVMDAESQRIEDGNGPRPNLGPTELQRLLATIGGAGIGTTEAFPFLHDYSGQIKRTIPRVLGAVGEGMVEEGLIQEPGQTVLENLNARAFYDPNRNPLEGVEDAATAALITGGAAKGGQQIAEEYFRQPAEAPSPFGGLLPPPSGGNLTEDEGIVFEDRDEADIPPPDRVEEPTLEERDAPPPVRIAQDPERPTTPIEEVLAKPRERRAWRDAGNAVTEYAPPPKEGEDRGEPIPEDEFADLVKISRDFYNQPPAVLQSRSVAPAEAPGATETPPEASARPEPSLGDGTRMAPIAARAGSDIEPIGDLVREPTEAQRAAGNYQKGHLKVQGLDISVETPKGGTRRGPGWEVQMPAHYGYIKRTTGKDGDHVDVTIGENPEAPNVTIIDQRNPKTGRFDEHKVMMGFDNEAQAVDTYRKSYSGDFAKNTIGPTRTVPVDEFKAWLKDGDTTKPYPSRGEVPNLTETSDGRPRLDDGRPEADGAQARELPGPGELRGGDERVQEPDARADATAEEPLRGAPDTVDIPGRGRVRLRPLAKARQAARDYAKAAGIPYKNVTTYATVDKGRAKRVAQAYDEMKHAPQDPKVKAAYRKMIDETVAQYREIEKTGLKIEFIRPDMEDPYAKSPRYAQLDVEENNHLWVFPTDDGFGSDASFDPSDNPLLEKTDVTIDGRQLRANDVFRIVHDYFGHFKNAVGFRADGEENAWRAHSAMYSPEARKAMTSETRGQNSWVNYGPNGETNRSASAADTVYADQKVGLLPDWAIEEGAGDAVEAPSIPDRLGMRIEDRAKGRKKEPKPLTKGPSDGFDPVRKKPEQGAKQRKEIERRFREDLGFRDVRIHPTDHAFAVQLYDELIDVATILKIPRTTFSGGGVLKLTLSRDLSSREVMGERAVKKHGVSFAYYMPMQQEIIIDINARGGKSNALSSFFHEWFHYLDHALFHGTAKPTATGLLTSHSHDLMNASFARPEVARAMDHLMRVLYGPEALPLVRRGERMATVINRFRSRNDRFMGRTNKWLDKADPGSKRDNDTYFKRSDVAISIEKQVQAAQEDVNALYEDINDLLAKGKTSKYFAEAANTGAAYYYQPWEMAARAFQLYVASKATSDRQMKGIEFSKIIGDNPFPHEEASQVFDAFDNLFATLKTRRGVRGYELYALGNAGDVDRIRGLYNPLIRSVENLKVTKAPASQWLGTLFEKDKAGKWRPKGGALKDVRTEIIDWTGIIPWLEGKIEAEKTANKKESISREEVLDFLRLHDVVVTEVWNDEGSRPSRPPPPTTPRQPSLNGIRTPEQMMKQWEAERTEEYTVEIDSGETQNPDESYLFESAEQMLEDRYGHWADGRDDLEEFVERYEIEDIEDWVVEGGASRVGELHSLTVRQQAPLSRADAINKMARDDLDEAPTDEDIREKISEIKDQISAYESLLEYSIDLERQWYYEDPDMVHEVTISQGEQEWTETVYRDRGGDFYWNDDPSGAHNYSREDRLKAAIVQKYLDNGSIREEQDINDDEREAAERKFREEYESLIALHKDAMSAEIARYEREKAEYAVAKQKWDDEVASLAALGSTRHHRYTPEPKLPQKDYFELKLAIPDLDGSFVVSSHFNHNNIVVHARFFHHEQDGKKYLVLGEVQTDLIQQIEQRKQRLKKEGRGNEEPTLGQKEAADLGRKADSLKTEREGRYSAAVMEAMKKLPPNLSSQEARKLVEVVSRSPLPDQEPLPFDARTQMDGEESRMARDVRGAERRIGKELVAELRANAYKGDEERSAETRSYGEVLPNAPFRQESKGGLTAAAQVMLKRMLRWAVDHGMDGITWTTGAQQAMVYGRQTKPSTIAYRWTKDGKLDVMNSAMSFDKIKGETRLSRFDIAPKPIPEAQARLIFGDDLVEVMKANFGKVGSYYKDAAGKLIEPGVHGDNGAPEGWGNVPGEPREAQPGEETGSLVFGDADKVGVDPEMFKDAEMGVPQWRVFGTTLFGEAPVLSSEGQHLQYDV